MTKFSVIHTVGGIAERLGGPSRTVTSLCSALCDLDSDITVNITSQIDNSLQDKLVMPKNRNVNISLIDLSSVNTIKLFFILCKQVADLDTNHTGRILIHDHGIWAPNNLIVWLVSKIKKIPYVLSPRGMLDPWALGHKAIKKKLAWLMYQRRIVRSASVVIATSEMEKINIQRLFPKKSIAVIPNGVDLNKLVSHNSSRYKTSTRTVLFMSRLHHKKNVVGLLHAWRRLPDTILNNWRLHICGPDENNYKTKILDLINDLKLSTSVSIIGPIDEANKTLAFQSADIFILPSFSENFGVVIAEALAHNLPVITTSGTPWQILQEKKCGWWVPPDPISLSLALMEATKLSDDDRAEMGARGRTLVEETFEWTSIAAQTQKVYLWVLGLGAKPKDIL